MHAAALGTDAFDILHVSDRRKDLEVIRKEPALCAQFIDMCSFIAPQIKFGDPASAVMYYKAQMGGRARWGGRNETWREAGPRGKRHSELPEPIRKLN